MSNTAKKKAIILVLIYIISIVLIVVGANMNKEGETSSDYDTISLNTQHVKTNAPTNYSVEFTPTSSGYYYIYIDGARISEKIDNGYSSAVTLENYNSYKSGMYYDYQYETYLYSGTTYLLKTNSTSGSTIKIYISR